MPWLRHPKRKKHTMPKLASDAEGRVRRIRRPAIFRREGFKRARANCTCSGLSDSRVLDGQNCRYGRHSLTLCTRTRWTLTIESMRWPQTDMATGRLMRQDADQGLAVCRACIDTQSADRFESHDVAVGIQPAHCSPGRWPCLLRSPGQRTRP